MHSWRMLILPYIDQEELLKDYQLDEPWDGPNNRKLASRRPNQFVFHGDDRPGDTATSYLAIVGPETVWRPGTGVPSDIVKLGHGNTILFVENQGARVHWMEPRDLNLADMDFTVGSPNGVSSKYADPAIATVSCTVLTLRRSMSPETLRAMCTIEESRRATLDDKGNWELLPEGRPVSED